MKHKWMIVIGIGLMIGIGIIFGIYFFQQNESEKQSAHYQNIEKIGNTIYGNETKQNIVETSSTEEKVSPNAMIQKRIYYKMCDHFVTEEEKVPTEDVNQTEKEIETKYVRLESGKIFKRSN